MLTVLFLVQASCVSNILIFYGCWRIGVDSTLRYYHKKKTKVSGREIVLQRRIEMIVPVNNSLSAFNKRAAVYAVVINLLKPGTAYIVTSQIF